MTVTRCLAVIDRADEMAVRLYEHALEIADNPARPRDQECVDLLEGSADVIRNLTNALRIAAVIALRKDGDSGPGIA